MFLLGSRLPCSLRASSRDVYLAEQGVAHCRRGRRNHVPVCDAPTAPDEGAALGGRERSGEGQRQYRLDHRKGSSRSGPSYLRSARSQKIATWSAGRARLPARAGGAPSPKVPQETCAVPALRLPQGGNRKTRAGPGPATGKSGDPPKSSRGAEDACLDGGAAMWRAVTSPRIARRRRAWTPLCPGHPASEGTALLIGITESRRSRAGPVMTNVSSSPCPPARPA